MKGTNSLVFPAILTYKLLVVGAHGTITPKCGVHMRPVGAGSRCQATYSHHLGLQMRLQLLRCFRSLSCRADKAWATAGPPPTSLPDWPHRDISCLGERIRGHSVEERLEM